MIERKRVRDCKTGDTVSMNSNGFGNGTLLFSVDENKYFIMFSGSWDYSDLGIDSADCCYYSDLNSDDQALADQYNYGAGDDDNIDDIAYWPSRDSYIYLITGDTKPTVITAVKATEENSKNGLDISDWKVWRDSSIRVGECVCGIAKQECNFHKD